MMRAIWLAGRNLRLREDVSIPAPGGGEALIRVIRAGICNTDLEMVKGYYPFTGILGHEFVGIVESGPDRLVGRRVVGEINAVCNHCRECRAGRSSHCLHRTVMGIVGRHGAFAEFLTLPVENLHFVPDTVSSDRATFVEPLAAALEIGEQVEISNESKVLVVGDGKLGLLIAQSMVNRDCQITTLGRHPKKLEILARLGIRTCRELDPATASFDIAVECTGNNQGTEVALKSLRPRGILVLKSTYHGRLKLDMSAVVVNEITLIGSRCGPFPQAIEMIRQGKIDLDSMISGRFPLAQGVDAFEAAAARGALKILVDIE